MEGCSPLWVCLCVCPHFRRVEAMVAVIVWAGILGSPDDFVGGI